MKHQIKTIQDQLREPSMMFLLVVQSLVIFVLGPLLSSGSNIPLGLFVTICVMLLVVVASQRKAAMIAVVVA